MATYGSHEDADLLVKKHDSKWIYGHYIML